ncbi:unnamed protein product [Paramecium primaurelia]|uniref:MORN repeat protein n=1 Tax=Paramecium primaurelia TaxID=5886 RepID=A0A8S1P5T6_PARPR|nr:unnamed protein product [Paramecium primaurelia]
MANQQTFYKSSLHSLKSSIQEYYPGPIIQSRQPQQQPPQILSSKYSQLIQQSIKKQNIQPQNQPKLQQALEQRPLEQSLPKQQYVLLFDQIEQDLEKKFQNAVDRTRNLLQRNLNPQIPIKQLQQIPYYDENQSQQISYYDENQSQQISYYDVNQSQQIPYYDVNQSQQILYYDENQSQQIADYDVNQSSKIPYQDIEQQKWILSNKKHNKFLADLFDYEIQSDSQHDNLVQSNQNSQQQSQISYNNDQEQQLQELALQYADGYIYRGQGYEPATKEGFGILTDENDNKVYKGYWHDNQYHGQGKLINFQAEQIDGAFDYQDLSGIENGWLGYEGEFQEGKFYGIGTLYLTNGEKFEGTFNDGMIDGEGVYSTINGQIIKGIWKEGILTHLI